MHRSVHQSLSLLCNGRIKIKLGAIYIPDENIKIRDLKKVYKDIGEEIDQGKKNGYKILMVGDYNSKIGETISGNTEEVTKGGKLLMQLTEKHDMVIVNATDKCT